MDTQIIANVEIDLKSLLDKKLEWLTKAHNEHICQKIAAVTRNLGEKENVRFREYQHWYYYQINGLVFHSADYFGNHIPGTDDKYYHHIVAFGHFEENKNLKIRSADFVNLEYTEGVPAFSIKGNIINDIEKSYHIFIPGKWVNVINELYEKATNIIATRVAGEDKIRAYRLAQQLFINPKIEI